MRFQMVCFWSLTGFDLTVNQKAYKKTFSQLEVESYKKKLK